MTIYREFITQGFSPSDVMVSTEMWFIYVKFYNLNIKSHDEFERLCEAEVLDGYLEEIPATHELLRYYASSRQDRFFRLTDKGKEITSIYVL